MIDAYLSVLELAYYELPFAFEGLADEHVWKRPAEGLLSIGELAGHIAYGEALRFAYEVGAQSEGEPDLSRCQVSSLLVDHRFHYYPTTIAKTPSEQQRAMTAQQVCEEVLRIHQESVVYFKAQNPDLDSIAPGWNTNFTYREFLKYAAFHVSYHTGQIYSARHLLGEQTPDN